MEVHLHFTQEGYDKFLLTTVKECNTEMEITLVI